MSLYNALFGRNPASEFLLALVGVDLGAVPRFRDASLSEDRKRVVIYTRTGGGNREYYEAENEAMTENPNFISDYDDDFDSTYAYWEFGIPEKLHGLVAGMAADDNRPVGEKFQALCQQLEANADTPEAKRALEVGTKLLGQLQEATRVKEE